MRFEHWLYTVPLRLRSLFRRGRVEDELDEELQYHLERQIQEHIAKGLTPDEARYAALRTMGGLEQRKEECRNMRRMNLIEDLGRDLRYGLRMLRRSPGFATVAVVTLALGIGVNTGMYSIVHAIMIRPLPAHEPHNLVRVFETNASRGLSTFSASIPNYLSWKQDARSLELAAFIRVSRNVTGAGEPERLEGVAATSSFLPVLGATMQLGRWFRDEEERPGEHRAVVLSDGFWKRRFGQNTGVVGHSIVLDGNPHTIVGIARPELGIPPVPDVWVPLLARPQPGDPNANRGNRFLTVIGRLRPGFTREQARSEMISLAGELERQFPGTNRGWSAGLAPLLHWLVPREIRIALVVLLGAVGMVMLIACANVANLLLARAEARRKEMAIRAAIGAGRSRLSRQLLTESILLSLIGGTLGIAVGSVIVQVARRYLVEIVPRAQEIRMDLNLLAVGFGMSVLTGLLFGMAPLVQLGKMRNLEALHEAGRTSQPAPRSRLRASLVVAQVSLATVLLVGAGLLIQSFVRLQQVSLGMEPYQVLTARINLPSEKYWRPAAYSTLLSRLTDTLRSAPGVRAAGVSSAIPLGPGSHTGGTAAAVSPSDSSVGQPVNCAWRSADAGFFATLGIPVLRGNVFDREDRPGGRRVFVISQETARRLYGADDPIGRQLRMNDAVGEVIGVVGDIRMRSLSDPPDRVVYLPLSQAGFFGVFTVFVRTHNSPEAATALIRERLREIDPNLPAHSFRPMRDWVENNSAPARIRTWVLAMLAGVALALGIIGIYGVLAYLVTLRRHEFGVRLALGARPGSLLRLVLAHGFKLVLAGVTVGLAGAVALASLLETLLFGVRARDPMTFLAVAILLSLAALTACYLPARRASKVDPMVALRHE
jgi:predicted permease